MEAYICVLLLYNNDVSTLSLDAGRDSSPSNCFATGFRMVGYIACGVAIATNGVRIDV